MCSLHNTSNNDNITIIQSLTMLRVNVEQVALSGRWKVEAVLSAPPSNPYDDLAKEKKKSLLRMPLGSKASETTCDTC